MRDMNHAELTHFFFHHQVVAELSLRGRSSPASALPTGAVRRRLPTVRSRGRSTSTIDSRYAQSVFSGEKLARNHFEVGTQMALNGVSRHSHIYANSPLVMSKATQLLVVLGKSHDGLTLTELLRQFREILRRTVHRRLGSYEQGKVIRSGRSQATRRRRSCFYHLSRGARNRRSIARRSRSPDTRGTAWPARRCTRALRRAPKRVRSMGPEAQGNLRDCLCCSDSLRVVREYSFSNRSRRATQYTLPK